MTLIEMLVALTIMGLMFALALSTTGPWLQRGRSIERDAQFWRSVEPARAALDELTASAVNLDKLATSNPDRVAFEIVAPRLSPDVQRVDLSITDRTRLTLHATGPKDANAILLANGPRLRLRVIASDETHDPIALVVDEAIGSSWTPLIIAPFTANAPLVCAFDNISRTCR